MAATKAQEVALAKLTELMGEQRNIGSIDIRQLVDGNMQILKNGKLKLPLSLPADILLENNDLRDVVQGNWKAIPVLMFVHPEDVRDEDGNQIVDEESTEES